MSNMKEFSYSDIFQRRVVYINGFITFFLTGFIFSDLVLELVYYFFYFPVIKVIYISLLAGIFFGNLTGRLLFNLSGRYRIVYISSEILFILISALYITKNYLVQGGDATVLFFFNNWAYSIPAIIAAAGFAAGIKINYFLKISCGTFLDDKQAVADLIVSVLLGVAAGIAVSYLRFYGALPVSWQEFSNLVIIFPALLIPSIFLIKLQYNPEIKYAQHFIEDDEKRESVNEIKDSLVFTYLNFSYTIIYIYLGLETVLKYYGATYNVKLIFIVIVVAGLLIGLLIGIIVKGRFSHIYTEILYPVFFVPFVHLLNNFHDKLPFYYGMLIIIPSIIVFGYSLTHTITNVLNKFDHRGRFLVIEFSMLILPAPILIALSFINFTYLLFFGTLYVIAVLNIIIPGINILSRKISGYKKLFYVIISFVLILSVIFSHQYFNINLSGEIYVTRTGNFNTLSRTNFNAYFIKNRGTVTLNNEPVFELSDSIIRNYKRSIVPVSLYARDEKGKILFIDGNQKFFRNPVIGFFKGAVPLDIIPEQTVDFNKLPVSGKIKYVPEEKDLLFYLKDTIDKFEIIVDIPNVLDQNKNRFRFTGEYYELLKKKIKSDGVFVQIFYTGNIRKDFLKGAVRNLKEKFRFHHIYIFSNTMAVMSSDSRNNMMSDENNYRRFAEFLGGEEELRLLFYNEFHVFTHLVSTDMDFVLSGMREDNDITDQTKDVHEKADFNENFYKSYTENNDAVMDIIRNEKDSEKFKNYIEMRLKNDKDIYTLLKKTEYAESTDNYEDETKHLFQLKKYTEYKTRLREYLDFILSYKEEYYYNTAIRLESEKKWEDARTLYMASLRINEKNFNTNYRLGLLCITLQDIDNAFKYLQNAMKINKKHPKVLYQMGVLLFSNGRTEEAIDYFHNAIAEKEQSAPLYFYLGLSYEKIGKFRDAESSYSRALILDPNDDNIRDRLEKIKIKMEDERVKWKTGPQKNQMEEEHGENFPLPINKSAFDWRLSDKDTDKK